MKKIYLFGNEDIKADNSALEVAKKLKKEISGIKFIEIKPNADLPFIDEEDVYIMDLVEGIEEVKLIDGLEIDKLKLPPRLTIHDFDLGFQLKYLKKIGKVGNITLIALPMNKEVDYNSVHSIFKKLVAQDMQGS